MANGKDAGNFVYAMVCTATGQYYIGRTFDLRLRYKQHLRNEKDAFAPLVNKYGEESIAMVALKANLSLKEAMAYEAKFIFQSYFCVNLINRTFPSIWNILQFVNDSEDESYWRELFRKIDEDQKAQSPRVKYIWKKQDSLCFSFDYCLVEKQRESWLNEQMQSPKVQKQLEGLKGRERKDRETNIKKQLVPLCPIKTFYTQQKAKLKYDI